MTGAPCGAGLDAAFLYGQGAVTTLARAMVQHCRAAGHLKHSQCWKGRGARVLAHTCMLDTGRGFTIYDASWSCLDTSLACHGQGGPHKCCVTLPAWLQERGRLCSTSGARPVHRVCNSGLPWVQDSSCMRPAVPRPCKHRVAAQSATCQRFAGDFVLLVPPTWAATRDSEEAHRGTASPLTLGSRRVQLKWLRAPPAASLCCAGQPAPHKFPGDGHPFGAVHHAGQAESHRAAATAAAIGPGHGAAADAAGEAPPQTGLGFAFTGVEPLQTAQVRH